MQSRLISSQRQALLHPNHDVSAAHPAIADAICAAGRAIADHVEPAWLHIWAHRVFWTVLAVSALAIDVAAANGWLP